MKTFRWIAAFLIAALCLGFCAFAAAEASAEPDEWTVMFYFCGSDLESKHGYASDDLVEIAKTTYPYDLLRIENGEPTMRGIGKVNILIQTGGSRAWHSKAAGIDVDTDTLQRWRYNYSVPQTERLTPGYQGYELMESLPLQSMAAPETLADFIRWSAQTCPAKKYALVLWDHGNGAKTGLFIDELFGNDEMYLYELKQALTNSCVHLEALVIDACLMANIETAWSVRDAANWMIASEEVIPGEGTALSDWLQTLVSFPAMDGRTLGRCVCDMTAIQYANGQDEMSRSLLTWSVINLSRIDRLVNASEKIFHMLGTSLSSSDYLVLLCAHALHETEEYGDGKQNMLDLGSLIYHPFFANVTNIEDIWETINALSDAVDYTARGPGRNEARGLSFCYPAGSTDAELDIYAQNFPQPEYLSFLDAISPWTAPDWVYEQADRLPEIDTIELFQIPAEKKLTKSGMPALYFRQHDWLIKDVAYSIYKEDDETGQIIRLGHTDCGVEDIGSYELLWTVENPMHWPAVDGKPCSIDLIKYDRGIRLYNIPVKLASGNAILRCGRTVDSSGQSKYEVYGIWEGYDENSSVINRGVEPLAVKAGQLFCLLYPTEGFGSAVKTSYVKSDEMVLPRTLDMAEITLSAGTYYLQFELEDLFNRKAVMERIEMRWDGQNMVFPDSLNWEGAFTIDWVR